MFRNQTTGKINISVFWVIAPFSLVDDCQHIGGTYVFIFKVVLAA
jgi:hypothetical protein